jgi:hypothetical protein
VVDSSVYFDDDDKGKMSTAVSIDLSMVENCNAKQNDDINSESAQESMTQSTTATNNNTYFFYQGLVEIYCHLLEYIFSRRWSTDLFASDKCQMSCA